MTAIVLSLVLAQAADIDVLLSNGKYQEAVAQAPDADTLLRALLGLPRERIAAVVSEVVQLRGILKDANTAADWLVRLSEHRPIRDEALTSAAYLYLVAGKPTRAIEVLEPVLRRAKTGLALAYLADAYRRLGDDGKAAATLLEAARRDDAPPAYLQDAALALGARRRAQRDTDGYTKLLAAVGLGYRAGMWLKDDAFYEPDERKANGLRKDALTAFRAGLGDDAPAAAFFEAAGIATGDERFDWLVEAVRRGRVPEEGKHAVPGAIVELARECASRKRPVAALALAQQRLRLGPCPAAWEVIESLPPATRAP